MHGQSWKATWSRARTACEWSGSQTHETDDVRPPDDDLQRGVARRCRRGCAAGRVDGRDSSASAAQSRRPPTSSPSTRAPAAALRERRWRAAMGLCGRRAVTRKSASTTSSPRCRNRSRDPRRAGRLRPLVRRVDVNGVDRTIPASVVTSASRRVKAATSTSRRCRATSPATRGRRGGVASRAPCGPSCKRRRSRSSRSTSRARCRCGTTRCEELFGWTAAESIGRSAAVRGVGRRAS